jgi:quinolinate synthase
MREDELRRDVRAVLKDRNGLLPTHNYQGGEIQDVADIVGDSLGLSMEATLEKMPQAGHD